MTDYIASRQSLDGWISDRKHKCHWALLSDVLMDEIGVMVKAQKAYLAFIYGRDVPIHERRRQNHRGARADRLI
jgi:hypothetical protein